MENPARYLPVMLDLSGRPCVVVGGGAVAARKVRLLVECGARVRVIAPDILPEISAMAGVEAVHRNFRAGDLAGAFVAVAATDSPDVNEQVAKEAASLRIPVNVVDEPRLCSFIMPSIARRGRLVVAVSTCGAAPALAARIRREIEEQLPRDIGDFVELMAEIRDLAEKSLPNAHKRAELLERLCDKRYREIFQKDGPEAARAEMKRQLEQEAAQAAGDTD